MKMDDYDVTINKETTVSIPEHEILLSFNSDWQAEKFWDWWDEIGREGFVYYVNSDCGED